ncbi:2254_t:CDS:2 [Dentiscutata erythropus]|uniref:2254_t:CDS:1 n=1 Tax=Dentiscutata erythropus TaxID=1348616 RepID=A0A9N8VEB5_9GLOM|nr:2254_t:CDS:2 [Dentiscutata erythropus]
MAPTLTNTWELHKWKEGYIQKKPETSSDYQTRKKVVDIQIKYRGWKAYDLKS